MLTEPLTTTQLTTISAKIDAMAQVFTNAPMKDERRALYIRTMCDFSAFPFTFERLSMALDRAMERWERPGQVPTPHFIMSTIDPRY